MLMGFPRVIKASENHVLHESPRKTGFQNRCLLFLVEEILRQNDMQSVARPLFTVFTQIYREKGRKE